MISWLIMWFDPFFSQTPQNPPLFLYNTLTRSKEEFTPPSRGPVRMYNCGPTVYDTSHIGNLRSYVFADLVRRALEYNGFEVKQVINITDFGHLSSDSDSGNDKMTVALKREKLEPTLENMRTLAERYTRTFLEDLQKLNIYTEHIEFPRASDYIAGEIALAKTLEEKGYAYRGKDGLYFDTSAFPTYGSLGNIDIEGLKEGARVASAEDKRNPTDFLLWKSDPKIGWDSPWGKGFPGWHIECSAMINATLGKQIDIHTGGIDLMPTHHTNEIAQSETATGKAPLSRFWMHHAFLNLNKEKISKSLGNEINLHRLIEKGFHPLSYRYYLLGAHYRTAIDFSWEALGAAQTAFGKLIALRLSYGESVGTVPAEWKKLFLARINDDLDTPGSLAVLWEMLKDKHVEPRDKLAGLLDFDNVLGLHLAEPDTNAKSLARAELRDDDIPPSVRDLIRERATARGQKDLELADSLRQRINDSGYHIDDAEDETRARAIPLRQN